VQKTVDDIAIFLIIVSALILGMATFVFTILALYRKRQAVFTREIQVARSNYEKNLLAAHIEIQEQTFQNISREIHDNITSSLTLAQLNLHTIKWTSEVQSKEKVRSTLELLTQSLKDLNNLSKGLNADIIYENGLLKVLEEEVNIIRGAGLFTVDFMVSGTPIYLDAKKELIIFRIIQEAFNNIIKHAKAEHTELSLDYSPSLLEIVIKDNGKGINTKSPTYNRQSGLKNIRTRTEMLAGVVSIKSYPLNGTTINIKIPLNHE